MSTDADGLLLSLREAADQIARTSAERDRALAAGAALVHEAREALEWTRLYAEDARRRAANPPADMGAAMYSTRELSERVNAALKALAVLAPEAK